MSEALDNQTLKFLARHGYLSNEAKEEVDPIDLSVSQLTGDLIHAFHGKESLIEQGLIQLQKFYGLDPTGILDAATTALVKLPRCTNKDVESEDTRPQENASFSLARRWNKNVLTWRVLKFPSNDLSDDLVRKTMDRAFSVWSKHADLKFIEDLESNNPDIKILFESGDHNDGDAFDKAGGTLAHAFFPGQGDISGDIHFDDDEYWTLGSYTGINLTQVAVHELGHSLGLEHSRVRGAIMFPSYEGYRPNLDLAEDDIRRIQDLYGPQTGEDERGRELDPEEEWIPGGSTHTIVQLLTDICVSCSIQ